MKYLTRKEFSEKSAQYYKEAEDNKWFDIICTHMLDYCTQNYKNELINLLSGESKIYGYNFYKEKSNYSSGAELNLSLIDDKNVLLNILNHDNTNKNDNTKKESLILLLQNDSNLFFEYNAFFFILFQNI